PLSAHAHRFHPPRPSARATAHVNLHPTSNVDVLPIGAFAPPSQRGYLRQWPDQSSFGYPSPRTTRSHIPRLSTVLAYEADGLFASLIVEVVDRHDRSPAG